MCNDVVIGHLHGHAVCTYLFISVNIWPAAALARLEPLRYNVLDALNLCWTLLNSPADELVAPLGKYSKHDTTSSLT